MDPPPGLPAHRPFRSRPDMPESISGKRAIRVTQELQAPVRHRERAAGRGPASTAEAWGHARERFLRCGSAREERALPSQRRRPRSGARRAAAAGPAALRRAASCREWCGETAGARRRREGSALLMSTPHARTHRPTPLFSYSTVIPAPQLRATTFSPLCSLLVRVGYGLKTLDSIGSNPWGL